MRWYWTKIVIGALAIFGVGLGIMATVRTARHEVVRVVEGSGDISIPLPFLDFVFEGNQAGQLRRVVVHRRSPKQLSGFDVSVRLSDLAVLDQLSKGCRLTVDDPTHLTNETPFRCAAADAELKDFGHVTIQAKDEAGEWVDRIRVPLLLPPHVITEMQGHDVPARVAQAEASKLRELGDSMRVLGLQLKDAHGAERAEIRERMAEIEAEMAEVGEAMGQAIAERVTREVQLKMQGASGRATVEPAERPVVPKPPAGN